MRAYLGHLRYALLLLLGAVAVHQLRYALAFDAGTGHGHGGHHHHERHLHVAPIMPVIGLVVAALLSAVLVRTAVAPPRRAMHVRLARLWPIGSASILGLYVGQEFLAAELTSAHPPGLAGVFGAGGWIAVPIALVLGAIVAFAVRLSGLLEERAFGPRVRFSFRVAQTGVARVLAAVIAAPASPPPRFSAGRSPPLA